jgi:hypothetical protein
VPAFISEMKKRKVGFNEESVVKMMDVMEEVKDNRGTFNSPVHATAKNFTFDN